MSCCGFVPMPIDLPHPARKTVESKPFRLKGWHVLAILVAFFGIVATVNGVMMRIAISTMPGLDARNGYDVSQRYNKEITAARAQAALGYTANMVVQRAGAGARVTIDLKDRAGEPVTGLAMRARFEHPALRARDVPVPVIEQGPGHFVGAAERIADGNWTLVVEALREAGEHPVYISRNRIALEAKP